MNNSESVLPIILNSNDWMMWGLFGFLLLCDMEDKEREEQAEKERLESEEEDRHRKRSEDI